MATARLHRSAGIAAVVFVAISFAVVAGCTREGMENGILNGPERAVARSVVNDIARGDRKSVEGNLLPELQSKLPLAAMHKELPRPPLEMSFVRAKASTVWGGQRSVSAVYILEGKPGWAVAEISMVTSSDRPSMAGMYLQRTPGDPREASRFHISGLGVKG